MAQTLGSLGLVVLAHGRKNLERTGVSPADVDPSKDIELSIPHLNARQDWITRCGRLQARDAEHARNDLRRHADERRRAAGLLLNSTRDSTHGSN